ncbi:hypothetical protein SBRCBS47491_001302 [Sporothrix bragantina]|uniref:Suppressor of anucleate metulae protein B n=1 Tax=Sporothrix bragantina TaxID=671064 RepID=A0ABP0AXV9_9PEZI
MSSLPAGLEIRGVKSPPGQLPASRGRGLFATRSFAPGQEIGVFNKPLLVLPSGPDATRTCNYCLDPRHVPVKLCTGCRAVAYCGPACQRAHWSRFHKVECKALQAAFASAAETAAATPGAVVRPLPTPVRSLMLLILQWARSPEIRAAVDKLESNTRAFIANPELWDDFKMQAAAACKFSSWFSEDQIKTAVEALCRIHTNAFDRFEPDLDLSGSFLDVSLAMANHSCMPNAVVGFSGQAAYLRAQNPIAVGDEVTISYVDWTKPKNERQKGLRLYNFQCSCPRCRDDLDVYQATQISPILSLNDYSSSPSSSSSSSPQRFFSVVPDVDLLRNPPVLRDSAHNVTPQQVEAMYTSAQAILAAEPFEDDSTTGHLSSMRQLMRTCRPLIEAKRWAVEPLAQLMRLAVIHCIEVGNYAHLLVFACFTAQHVDSVQFPAPFATWRTKGLLSIAKALPHALLLVMPDLPVEQGGDGGVAAREARGQGGDPRRRVDPRVLDILLDARNGGLFMTLLMMIMHNGPLGHSAEWPPLDNARRLLASFQADPSHATVINIVNEWFADPYSPDNVDFFEDELLGPINRLSVLAPELLEALVKE